MEHLIVISIIILILTPICYLWVRGIDYMHKNYPDYKGEDLFGEDDKSHT
jgi:hypothetical protein